MEFESREHALNWMIANQLGRRNLNPNQIAYLRGKRYENEKVIATFKGNQYVDSGGLPNANHQNNKPKTSESLGEEYGVNQSTIIRSAQFAKAVDLLPDEIKTEVLAGRENISRNAANAILKMDKPTQKKFLKEVESGTPIKEAIKKYGCYYRKFRDFKREKISPY